MSVLMNMKKLNEKAIVPTYGSVFAAGADLYACEEGDVTIAPAETKLIHTGLAMEIPEGLEVFRVRNIREAIEFAL